MIKMCDKHWNMLRAEIDNNGLNKFIAGTGEDVIEKMIGDPDDVKNFDPLMIANIHICAFLIENEAIDGNMADGCPICVAMEHQIEEIDWIRGAVNDQLQYAIKAGLITKQ